MKKASPVTKEVKVTKEELEEFKKIAFKEYSIELTDEEALEQATALLNLFDQLIKSRR